MYTIYPHQENPLWYPWICEGLEMNVHSIDTYRHCIAGIFPIHELYFYCNVPSGALTIGKVQALRIYIQEVPTNTGRKRKCPNKFWYLLVGHNTKDMVGDLIHKNFIYRKIKNTDHRWPKALDFVNVLFFCQTVVSTSAHLKAINKYKNINFEKIFVYL